VVERTLPPHMLEEVVDIACDSISTIKSFLQNSIHRTDRYFSSAYLVGVISILSFIIKAAETIQRKRDDAFSGFKKAVTMLEEIARGFNLARRMLQKCHGAIDGAARVIMSETQRPEALPELPQLDLAPEDASREQIDTSMFEWGRAANVQDNNDVSAGDVNLLQAGVVVSHFPTPATWC